MVGDTSIRSPPRPPYSDAFLNLAQFPPLSTVTTLRLKPGSSNTIPSSWAFVPGVASSSATNTIASSEQVQSLNKIQSLNKVIASTTAPPG